MATLSSNEDQPSLVAGQNLLGLLRSLPANGLPQALDVAIGREVVTAEVVDMGGSDDEVFAPYVVKVTHGQVVYLVLRVEGGRVYQASGFLELPAADSEEGETIPQEHFHDVEALIERMGEVPLGDWRELQP